MLSLVIIEYNSENEISLFLKKINLIKKRDGLDVEIIISSNSTYTIEKQKYLEKTYSDAQWVFNEQNGGFAYGMNRGIEKAKGEFIAVCNPDVEILSGLDDAMRHMQGSPQIGALGPQIINNEDVIQDSFRNFITVQRFIKRQNRRLSSGKAVIFDDGLTDLGTKSVPWVIGAFIMISRNALEVVGGLDEAYFLYCEDMDWCTRFWENGFKVVYFPALKVRYEGSRTARKKIKYTVIFAKSLLRYWKKFGFFSNKVEQSFL